MIYGVNVIQITKMINPVNYSGQPVAHGCTYVVEEKEARGSENIKLKSQSLYKKCIM